MSKLFLCIVLLFALSCSTARKPQKTELGSEAERILKTLSADEMQGRAAFTGGAEMAAAFIEKEFRDYGLQPLQSGTSFRQNFSSTRINTSQVDVKIDGKEIDPDSVAVFTDKPALNWNNDVEVINIVRGDNMFKRYNEIKKGGKQNLVLVDGSLAGEFNTLKSYLEKGRIIDSQNDSLALVFILGRQQAGNYTVNIKNNIETLPLFNVAATIPGKSKPNEIVIFSAHYDHIGILPAVNGDSIANGADDDASGVTAVLSLAKHFKELNNNERTLMFVTFTAEELGMVGSKYFSKNINADSVVAMFNVEMIGKESKFGKNAAFISGFDRSDFGEILQKNVKGSAFSFHPDPYPQLDLFYRSDNATLAALGVPAHTISTDQIDTDKYYHTVDDEYQTLNIENVRATIEGIALAASSIISGQDTPRRVPKR